MGILAPHLSQRADIPHLTAINPVRFELGVIIRLSFCWTVSGSSSTNKSAVLNLLKKKKHWYGDGANVVMVVVVVAVVVVTAGLTARRRRRESRPLDKADMVPDDRREGRRFAVGKRERGIDAAGQGEKEGLGSGTVGIT